MVTKLHLYPFCRVERSPYLRELTDFGKWLDASDYSQRMIRQHMINLDQVLREMAKAQGATHTPVQLCVAFGKHDACLRQANLFRSTQHRYQAYLMTRKRLISPAKVDPFASLRDRYRKDLSEVRGFANSTEMSHDSTVADFLGRALRPHQSIRALTADHVERYIQLKSQTNTRHSLQRIVANLRSFLSYCYHQGEIASRLDCIDRPRTYRGELLPRALNWSGIQTLLRSIDRDRGVGERDFAILHLMAHYGLRPSEIVILRMDSIDWHDCTLRVEQRKTRSGLILPMAPTTVRTLRRYIKRFRGDNTSRHAELFLRTKSPCRPLNRTAVSELFTRRAQQAGLGWRRYSAYSLRHGLAMRLLERGVGVKAIGDVLGHRDLESTCVYLRLDIDSLRDVALPVPRIDDTRGVFHA